MIFARATERRSYTASMNKLFSLPLSTEFEQRRRAIRDKIGQFPCDQIDTLDEQALKRIVEAHKLPIPEFVREPLRGSFDDDAGRSVTYEHGATNASSFRYAGTSQQVVYRKYTVEGHEQMLRIRFNVDEPGNGEAAKREHEKIVDAIQENVKVLRQEIPPLNDTLMPEAQRAAQQRRDWCKRLAEQSLI